MREISWDEGRVPISALPTILFQKNTIHRLLKFELNENVMENNPEDGFPHFGKKQVHRIIQPKKKNWKFIR